jgi:hypothetical protein
MRLPLFLLLSAIAGAAPPAWPDAVVRLERQPAGAGVPQISTALCVAPGLLATILDKADTADSFRAITREGNSGVQLLARDADSGFALLGPAGTAAPSDWLVVSTEAPQKLPAAGAGLTIQSAVPAPARAAGSDILQNEKLLRTPWLRIHIPAGAWDRGTPVTAADGSLAGLLAGSVPGVPEAARVLPAAAMHHFTTLWTSRQTLARAQLGIRVLHADGVPRIQQCFAALPAERAGIHPGDILLRIGQKEITDAASAAAACFFLRVDEPVKIQVLRGLETLELNVKPVKRNAP